MTDRADYLARTLIARLAKLQAHSAEDGRDEPDRSKRIETIEKVLAVELGVTDGPTLALVEAAAPASGVLNRPAARDVVAFAEFLRRRLARQLTEAP